MLRVVAVVVAVVALTTACSRADRAAPDASPDLVTAVDVEGVLEHVREFAQIASSSGGNRASGTSGYDRSADYVAARLEAAGLDVEIQRFDFPFFRVTGRGSVALADEEGYREGADFKAMLYSAPGRVRARIEPVDFDPGAKGRNGPGCSKDAYAGFPAGAIALIRPGPCFFRDQVEVAQDAGASAVIFAFPEYTGDGVLRPTLISPTTIEVPALAASNEMGLDLNRSAGEIARIRVEVESGTRGTMNVIGETVGGDSDEVIMLGGHLDSVVDGPGINDNGSGVAAMLEVAENLAGREPDKKIRFGFWAAEEFGLLGSTHYVARLEMSERARIEAYLNFDMVGSPNFVRYVYSDSGAPEGSEKIHDLFVGHFEAENIAVTDIDLEGRSDHGPFIQAGIPVGGLFTGADMMKTADEVKIFGGEAGRFEDPCYHQACDDLDNVDRAVLGEMADAIAHAVSALALEGG